MRQFNIRDSEIMVTISPHFDHDTHKPDGTVWMTMFGQGTDITVQLDTLDINDLVRALIHESERRE